MIGSFHDGISLGIFLHIIGALKTVPPKIFLIVPLGLFHIYFNLYSTTLASSGVIVAHFIPTFVSLIAFAQSNVT